MPYRSRDERLAYQRAYRQRPEVKDANASTGASTASVPRWSHGARSARTPTSARIEPSPEGAERALKRRLGEARRHDHRYWARYRLACRLAKERGDRHLAREDLIAVGLRS